MIARLLADAIDITPEGVASSRWFGSLDLPQVFLLTTAATLAIFAVRLAKTPWAFAADWWGTLVVIGGALAAGWLLVPASAGLLGLALFVGVVMLPLRLDRAAQRAMRAGDDAKALRLAAIARVLHPFGLVGRRRRSMLTLGRLAAGEPLDDAALEALGALRDPLLAELYRVYALHYRAETAECRRALAVSARRHRLLRLGFGPAWVRTIAQGGTSGEIVDAVREAERWDASLADPERRALVALDACAGLGHVEAVRELAAQLTEGVPRGRIAWAVASAHRARGEREVAVESASRALEDAHVRERPWLQALASPRATIVETDESRALVERLRVEARATTMLAPLAGTGKSRAILTMAIAAVLCLVFVVVEATGGSTDEAHLRACGALPIPLRLADAWTIFTSSMLHAGLLHLTFNVLALFVLGRFVEAFYGRPRMMAIWLLGTVTSALTAVAFAPRDEILVGASGAIFALGGAVLAALLSRRELRSTRRGRAELYRLLLVFGLQVVIDNMVPAISGAAHLGGLFGGALVGAMLAPRPAKKGKNESPEKLTSSDAPRSPAA